MSKMSTNHPRPCLVSSYSTIGYTPALDSLVLLVDRAHERGGGRENVFDKDENGLLWRQLDSFPRPISDPSYLRAEDKGCR